MRTILFAAIIATALSIEFQFTTRASDSQCFYEQLTTQAKFSIEIIPQDDCIYEFTIRTVGTDPRDIFVKETKGPRDSIRVSKMAPELNYYSFCVHNLCEQDLRTNFTLKTGLDLMEFEVLPNKADNQYVEKQVTFLEQQHNELFSSLEKVESARQATDTMLNIMSKKILGFGMIGFLVIIGVNYCIYREIKRTLYERKMI